MVSRCVFSCSDVTRSGNMMNEDELCLVVMKKEVSDDVFRLAYVSKVVSDDD